MMWMPFIPAMGSCQRGLISHKQLLMLASGLSAPVQKLSSKWVTKWLQEMLLLKQVVIYEK